MWTENEDGEMRKIEDKKRMLVAIICNAKRRGADRWSGGAVQPDDAPTTAATTRLCTLETSLCWMVMSLFTPYSVRQSKNTHYSYLSA